MSEFGPDYDEQRDGERIRKQLGRVLEFMREHSHEWLSIEEICAGLEAKHGIVFPWGSVDADLRHLKKPSRGRHDIRRQKRWNAAKGKNENFSEYRLFEREPDAPMETARTAAAPRGMLLAIPQQDYREAR